jgi:hypothetical protein
MHNLQDLYEYYITTKPSQGKLKSASSMLIHVCKILNLASPEYVTSDYYNEIPAVIDKYHKSSKNLAIQDKSIIAEMIGRYGPKDGWEKTFDKLLADKDSNLCQFTLHSLEYSGNENYSLTIAYIEKYMHHHDRLMRQVSAHLVCSLLCSDHAEDIKIKILNWIDKGDDEFNKSIYDCLEGIINNKTHIKNTAQSQAAYQWLADQLNILIVK